MAPEFRDFGPYGDYGLHGVVEMSDALCELRSSGAYSDLTLSCGPYKFKVHRSIVCPRSKFFASACEADQKKNKVSVIKLEAASSDEDASDGSTGDDPEAVKLMVDFLYHHNYHHCDYRPHGVSARTSQPPLPPRERHPKVRGRSKSLAFGKPPSDCEELILHIKMYTLGSKYTIKSLMSVALHKLERSIGDCVCDADFARVIRQAFATAVREEDAGDLQDIIVNAVQSNKDVLLEEQQVADTIANIGQLAFALWTDAKPRVARKLIGKKRCADCRDSDEYTEECTHCGEGETP